MSKKELFGDLKAEHDKHRDRVCVELADVERALCLRCHRGVVGICPYQGKEPGNPEKKAVCETLNAIRALKKYTIKAEEPVERGGSRKPEDAVADKYLLRQRVSELAYAAMVEGMQNILHWGSCMGDRDWHIKRIKPEAFDRLGLKVALGVESAISTLIRQANEAHVEIFFERTEKCCEALKVTAVETMGAMESAQSWEIKVSADVRFWIRNKSGQEGEFVLRLSGQDCGDSGYTVYLTRSTCSHSVGRGAAFDSGALSVQNGTDEESAGEFMVNGTIDSQCVIKLSEHHCKPVEGLSHIMREE